MLPTAISSRMRGDKETKLYKIHGLASNYIEFILKFPFGAMKINSRTGSGKNLISNSEFLIL